MSIKIDQAFVSAMLNAGLGLDIVYENGQYSFWNGVAYEKVQKELYKPSTDRPYIESAHFPAGKTPFTLSDVDEAVGYYQAIVKYPIGASSFAAKNKAESILQVFKIGATISYNGQEIGIERNSRSSGRVEGSFYQIVVRAYYLAFVNR